MPECRGISVHVTDVNGRSLPEWGVQHVNSKHQGPRVSAYIQSTTDAIFQISLQPRIPWCYSAKNNGGNTFLLSLSTSLEAYARVVVPPYAFVAYLYLDGRRQPERRAIISVDPKNNDYWAPDGKVILKDRRVQLKDGRVVYHGWAFKEKAIESVFDKLNLEGQENDSDEAALVNALLSSQLSGADKDQDENRVGQILVEIERVDVNPSYIYAKDRPRFREGQDDDIETKELQGHSTHRTGFVRKAMLPKHKCEIKRRPHYHAWRSSEGLYASFLFFYRSRDQLAKFGFPGFPPLPNGLRKEKNFLDNTFSHLTPLSISMQAGFSAKQAKAEPGSFEDRVKKRKSSRISADAQIPTQSDRTLPPQLRSFSDPVENLKTIALPKVRKPISRTTVPPPLPPSLQEFKKMQPDKLASQPLKTFADAGADMDISEPDTESELESLVEDDIAPTHPNPDEDNNSHEVLREHFKNFRIKKSMHDAVDQKLEERSVLEELSAREPNLVAEALIPTSGKNL